MYERFYSLRERPFSLSPDPDYLYPSRVHKEALSYLRYGIEGHAGFIVITGDIGCGKTTLLQTVLRGLDRQTSVSRLVNTMLDARELVEAVMLDFGLDPGHGRSKPHLLRDLARYLVDQRSTGRLALLVIDEAQNLSLAALEEVRMLSNLETEKSKLIQIVLIGQPSLRDLLGRPELEQLRQRITVSYHLNPLDSDDTRAYINHRLRRAAIGVPLEFSHDVTDLIHLHSQGVPRKINVISDAVLLFGYGEEQRSISVDLTQEAIEELEATGVIASPASTPFHGESAPRTPAPSLTNPDLAAREARLAQRERQLAEQQRVLAEEYRLIRLQRETMRPPASETAAGAAPASWPPPRPRPSTISVSEPAPLATTRAFAPRRIAAPNPPSGSQRLSSKDEPEGARSGLWARMRRGLFGESKSGFRE
jgi:putative secretion ATPase (PEP-CTERM system associated)